ncbi:MAG: prepilin peptidase [Planctomycetes bacterium]|nr:prepilin peptidase [Planctomycetota bacterium]
MTPIKYAIANIVLWGCVWAGATSIPDEQFFQQDPRPLFLLVLLLVCAITDLWNLKIYNWATYGAFLLMVVVPLCIDVRIDFLLYWFKNQGIGAPIETILPGFGSGATSASWQAACGALVCGLVVLPVWVLTRRGGGDLKLAIVIGAALGPALGLHAIGLTYIVGGIATLLWMAVRLGPWQTLLLMLRSTVGVLVPRWGRSLGTEELFVMQRPIPLGGFFLLGTVLVLGGVA